MGKAKRKCVSCGGTNLCRGTEGNLSNSFMPRGKSFWMTSVPTYELYACLDCGFVNQYFDEKQLDKLRQRVTKE